MPAAPCTSHAPSPPRRDSSASAAGEVHSPHSSPTSRLKAGTQDTTHRLASGHHSTVQAHLIQTLFFSEISLAQGIIFSKLAPMPSENKVLADLRLCPSQSLFRSLVLRISLGKKVQPGQVVCEPERQDSAGACLVPQESGGIFWLPCRLVGQAPL